MKNILLKTCLTALAVSVAGLAYADNTQSEEVAEAQIDLSSYSVISGAALNLAAHPKNSAPGSHVNGHLAAQAAVSIGAYTTVNDIYAGAAVTIGVGSQVKQISAVAAVGVATYATAQDINAGAAVVLGAYGEAGAIYAGAAITLEANSKYYSADAKGEITYGAGATIADQGYANYEAGFIQSTDEMTAAMTAIKNTIAMGPHDNPDFILIPNTDLSADSIGVTDEQMTYHGSAINLQSDTTLTIHGDVTVITSEAMTLGAGAKIKLMDGATVEWRLGGALNLGIGSEFHGDAYVNGAVNGATSDVCGNLYAIGAVSVQSINSSACTPCPLWDSEESRDAVNSLFTNKLIRQQKSSGNWISDTYYDGEVRSDWYNGSYTDYLASPDDSHRSLYAQYEVNGYSVAKFMYQVNDGSIIVTDVNNDYGPQHSLDAPAQRVLDPATGSQAIAACRADMLNFAQD
jgi:hypothetical protein